MSLTKKKLSALLVTTSLVLAGCAGVAADGPNDPLEGMNRVVFGFNEAVDHAVLGPVARAYGVVPQPIRDRVRDFSRFVTSPVVLVHDVIQLEGERALNTFGRIMINTTMGGFGLVDIAGQFGLPHHSEDAGQSLGAYGAGTGPYLVLPLLGPSTARDATGRVVDAFLDPVSWIEGISSLRIGSSVGGALDSRQRLDPVIADGRKNALDFYAHSRSLYLQNRAAEVANEANDQDDGLADIPVYAN